MDRFYPIGTPGQPWTDVEKAAWYDSRRIQRSYRDEVLAKLDSLGGDLRAQQYGALSIDRQRYPLVYVTSTGARPGAPWASSRAACTATRPAACRERSNTNECARDTSASMA
jgi:hypothetical protein